MGAGGPSALPANAVVGGASYTVAAVATSGNSVTLSADCASAGICTVTGNTVDFDGAGTCVIDAGQLGGNNFDPAPQVQQSVTVSKAPPRGHWQPCHGSIARARQFGSWTVPW